ncbi:Rieske (2Fe-2S) protein [Streptomyces mangrovisoli]|uniref:Rieske domain-containing protein n=1 Tax=Streptomyces mangrovisoli TaxID=1428628 RepID=A0A1J4NW76_9ACTN|nr:Rieske 2Fe-2S domain-containing protein [Streptomyces mangrovisoli]OIJ65485.1 hypothetical protein WN71_023350 [Streptomyces mangrovisoli]
MLVDICDRQESRRRFTVEGAGRVLAVFWDVVAARPVVTDGRCPHAGAPLQDGWLYHGAVVCPWHRYRFSPEDGACENTDAYRLAVYPVTLTDGRFVAEVPVNPLGTAAYRAGRMSSRQAAARCAPACAPLVEEEQ